MYPIYYFRPFCNVSPMQLYLLYIFLNGMQQKLWEILDVYKVNISYFRDLWDWGWVFHSHSVAMYLGERDMDSATISTRSRIFPYFFSGGASIHLSCLLSILNLKNMTHAVIMSALWSIWRARNNMIFNKVTYSLVHVIKYIKTITFLWVKNRGKGISLNWVSWCIFPFVVS